MNQQVKIFDTTLRDGEQSPGCSMNLKEKLEVAKLLERLRVDVIEAGFAISSPGDFEAVQAIARQVRECTVASLARCVPKDIDAAWEAVKCAEAPRLHVFLATSPIHMEYKLKMTPEQVIERTAEMVRYARTKCPDVEFSCEDATRSAPDFLVRVVSAAVRAGATTINLPDTVGYTTPPELRQLLQYVREQVGNEEITYSVHCHNDLGMAVANSLAGVQGGARQIECTINGLGERAGNTSLEEVVMALRTRHDAFGCDTRIDTRQIFRSSQLIYNIIGQSAPLNKPIVGRNAFVHESGIHQHGVLANKETYEIMTPESVGISTNNIVLGKHSGRHAFETHLLELGFRLSPETIEICFEQFKLLCDKKKSVTDADLRAIVTHNKTAELLHDESDWTLDWFAVHTSNFTTATATVSIRRGDRKFKAVSLGDGPVDAVFAAIDSIIKPPTHQFNEYSVFSSSEGKDTMGEATVKLLYNNVNVTGRGLSTDVIEASIDAYLAAMNRLYRALPDEFGKED